MEKGARILHNGPDFQKIHQSVAIELSNEPARRKNQVEANQRLILSSQGQLAPLSGQERYLSLGSSHLSQFCRAMMACSKTDQQELAANGHLSMEVATKGQLSTFQDMCTKGWPWLVVQSEVESAFPWLPVLVQQALNSVHNVAMGATEMETMRQVAEVYHHQKNLQAAFAQAAATKPKCMPYIGAIGHFAKHFAGGETFQLVKLLVHVSTLSTK